MKERLKQILILLGCSSMALLPTACIDENMDDCGKDYRLTYTLHLITNMDDEIQEELKTPEEVELGKHLRQALTTDVFREYAHDIDLSFYESTNSRSYHETHIMDAGKATYTIYLPVQQYQHLAITNVESHNNVSLTGDDMLNTTKLQQVEKDTIESHNNGLYTARLSINSERNQDYDVPLYISTDAAALVLDPNGVTTTGIRTYLTDLADGFSVNDSVYTYNNNPIIRTIAMPNTGSNLICHYGIGLPSRNVSSRAAFDHAEQGSIWQMRVYVALTNGKITENLLYVKEPLKAGYLKIIKGILREDGTIVVSNPEVSVGVNLEWKEGNTYTPIF